MKYKLQIITAKRPSCWGCPLVYMWGAHCAIYWGGTSSCLHMGFVFLLLLFCQHWMCRSSLNQFVSFMYTTITSASASSLLSPLLSYSLPLRRPETGVWAWSRACILITLTLDTWWERAVKLSKHISMCRAAAPDELDRYATLALI